MIHTRLFFAFFLFFSILISFSDVNAADPTPSEVNNLSTAPSKPAASPIPEHEISIYLNLGYANPAGPTTFSYTWAFGFSGGAGIGVGISRIFSVILDVNYNSFTVNQDNLNLIHQTAVGGNISDTLLMLNVKTRFSPNDDPVVPYGILGLGAAFYHADPVTITGVDFLYLSTVPGIADLNTTNFAYRIGLGIDIGLSTQSAIFVEGSYTGTSTGSTGISYGMAHTGLKLNL